MHCSRYQSILLCCNMGISRSAICVTWILIQTVQIMMLLCFLASTNISLEIRLLLNTAAIHYNVQNNNLLTSIKINSSIYLCV